MTQMAMFLLRILEGQY